MIKKRTNLYIKSLGLCLLSNIGLMFQHSLYMKRGDYEIKAVVPFKKVMTQCAKNLSDLRSLKQVILSKFFLETYVTISLLLLFALSAIFLILLTIASKNYQSVFISIILIISLLYIANIHYLLILGKISYKELITLAPYASTALITFNGIGFFSIGHYNGAYNFYVYS